MQKFSDTLAYETSRGLLAVAPSAQVAVYTSGSDDLATAYADDETTHLTNPVQADDEGLVAFKLANGTYDFVYSNAGGQKRVDGVVAFDAADADLGGGGKEESAAVTTVITCSTSLPVDGSKPQSTDGTEVVTVEIQPNSASSEIEVTYTLAGSTTSGMFVGAAVFQDSGTDALDGSCCLEQTTGANQKFQMTWTFRVASGSADSRTYKLRAGPHSSGTVYVNGDSSGSLLMDGGMEARITAREVLSS
jgi:hypothetical protein